MDQKDEIIDIALATYNGEKYLKEQIDSILNQTYNNIQIIISDDCSQDKTREILEAYANNPKIKIYYQEHNLGYIKNFEFLLQHVEHKLYMLADQDDVWLPEKIEKTLKKMQEEQADLVFTDLEIVDENLETVSKSFNRTMNKIQKIQKTLKTNQFEYLYNNITGCTILSKKKYIEKILPFPKNSKYVIHDSWIGLIMSFQGKIAYLDEPTILYRQHTNNQVGTEKQSYKAQKFNKIRTLFIEVKQDLFKVYTENESKFPEDLQILNKKGKAYFEEIANTKNVSFKNWGTFHKLYKNEKVSYYVLNFIILNMPILGRMLFIIRKTITKICKKNKKEETC